MKKDWGRVVKQRERRRCNDYTRVCIVFGVTLCRIVYYGSIQRCSSVDTHSHRPAKMQAVNDDRHSNDADTRCVGICSQRYLARLNRAYASDTRLVSLTTNCSDNIVQTDCIQPCWKQLIKNRVSMRDASYRYTRIQSYIRNTTYYCGYTRCTWVHIWSIQRYEYLSSE